MRDTRLLRAIATLVGTTIGAGIFGLPYAIARVGWGAGTLMLVGLGWVTLMLNLAFGEVILRTKGDHQLSGYGRIYFGKLGRVLGFGAVGVGIYGAMLAYTTQIGRFLASLLPFGDPLLFSLIFFLLASLVVGFGVKLVSEIELLLTTLIVVLVAVIAVRGWPEIVRDHLGLLSEHPDWLTPYGVVMFALAGTAVVPEIEEILREEHDKVWTALFLGTLTPLVVYVLFATVVVGVSGGRVSPDAISGLAGVFPVWVVKLGALLGALTMTTSFASLGYVLRELYFRDLGFSKGAALLLALAPVISLFLLGARSFIGLLEVTGILTGGLTGGLILALFLKAKREGTEEPAYVLPLPEWAVFILLGLFIFGVVARILAV
jgi:tyrosine-specific transport protein